jgi:hypothetical protein
MPKVFETTLTTRRDEKAKPLFFILNTNVENRSNRDIISVDESIIIGNKRSGSPNKRLDISDRDKNKIKQHSMQAKTGTSKEFHNRLVLSSSFTS